jgi:peptide/nickel transport system permease protein
MGVAQLQQRTFVTNAPTQSRSEWLQSWRRFRANRSAVVSLAFLILLCLVAIFAPTIIPYNPTESMRGMRGVGPSLEHPMGFDHLGRDLMSRVLYGARVSLLVGLVATAMSVVLGVIVGALAGYFGSWLDTILSRIVDALMAFPLLALLILLAAVVGASLPTTITVIGVTTWARFARVVRADVLSIKERDFVTAARAGGVTHTGIIFRHILPNVLGPVIVLATLGIGNIIILESALSFLGLGIPEPISSWGRSLSDGQPFMRQFPHITIFPGTLIFLTVLAFNLLGDGLRDALDPRQRS